MIVISFLPIYCFLRLSGQQLEKAQLFLAVRLSPDKNQKDQICPDSMLEHIFYKYPIPFGGVIDKDVGNGADDLTVLNNG